MTPSFLQGIVAVQIGLLALTMLLTFGARSRRFGHVSAWVSSILALVAVLVAGGAAGGMLGPVAKADKAQFLVYAVIGVIAAGLNWVAFRTILSFLHARYVRRMNEPQSVSMLSEQLREVLRAEGIELDARLRQAEQDREQFLYALEERHARQIAGLAAEYQHEAQTILRQLLDQLASDELQPMVEQRLAEQRAAIERELGALDSAAAGETLQSVRSELATLLESVDAAEARIAELRETNPDRPVEDLLDERMAGIQRQLDEKLAGSVQELDARVAQVGTLLDEKVEAASNPLAARMADTQAQVEARMQGYMDVLAQRFAETEQLLNARILEQESSLEARVVELEQGVEQRLEAHAASIESNLASHDSALQTSLAAQGEAVTAHFAAERDRLIGELTSQAATLQEQIATEMAGAEAQARETVAATQQAWNTFTEELEQRFADAREEALRAAREIADAERSSLLAELAVITEESSREIAAKVEEAGREAAWHRAQVERSIVEQTDALRQQAEHALANADAVFADLDRIGADRVAAIQSQAEEALIQSRDYVAQLQGSLGAHLDQLREQSSVMADDMNDRLAAVAQAAQQSASQLEAYSREVLDAAVRELRAATEGQVDTIRQRLQHDIEASITASQFERQRAYEQQVTELAQRMVQQVQGDLAGIAEHARAAVAAELEQQVAQGREHALRTQEQAHMQAMGEIARQQAELAEQARTAAMQARQMLEDGLRDSRRQLDEAMGSMGAHIREELVRFQDEGQRRVNVVIDQLRSREQELIRDEDHKLASARQELLRQHQGALQDQMRQMMGSLSGAFGAEGAAPAGAPGFATGVDRPATPLSGGQPTTSFGSF